MIAGFKKSRPWCSKVTGELLNAMVWSRLKFCKFVTSDAAQKSFNGLQGYLGEKGNTDVPLVRVPFFTSSTSSRSQVGSQKRENRKIISSKGALLEKFGKKSRKFLEFQFHLV